LSYAEVVKFGCALHWGLFGYKGSLHFNCAMRPCTPDLLIFDVGIFGSSLYVSTDFKYSICTLNRPVRRGISWLRPRKVVSSSGFSLIKAMI